MRRVCTPCWFDEHNRCYGCRCDHSDETHPDADRPDRNEEQ